jgi:phosphopantothenate-cysteine ligase
LIPKSRAALERYGHQVVIGNDLHRRKYEVVFVSRKHKPAVESVVPEFEESWLRIPSSTSTSTDVGHVKEIEEDIVNELVRRHDKWIQTGKSSL